MKKVANILSLDLLTISYRLCVSCPQRSRLALCGNEELIVETSVQWTSNGHLISKGLSLKHRLAYGSKHMGWKVDGS